jgi:hypothetical protein
MKTVSVSPFVKTLGRLEKVPVVSAAVAYDAPSGITYILIIHQALYLKDLNHNLDADPT